MKIRSIGDYTFSVVDLETTGFSPSKDEAELFKMLFPEILNWH